VAIATVAIYLLMAIVAFALPTVTGYNTTTIRLLDWSRQPVSGVTIRLSTHQPFSFRGALTPRTDAHLLTDSSGLTAARVNRDHTLYGTINAQTDGHRAEYRFATFMRSPNPDGTFRMQYSWSSNKEKHGNTNMHFHVSKAEKCLNTITVYLPSVDGDDTNPYVLP
jgi:hypothetical protein